MPKKILLADDSITIQKVVELTFSEGDYQVISVGNGALALQRVQEVRPDIALLDVIMPEASGYEVCEKLKQDPSTSTIPVLLLTGTFEPFDRNRAQAAGAEGHLTKPFESQVLIAKVEELIAAARDAAAAPAPPAPVMVVVEEAPIPPASLAAEPDRELIVPDRYDVGDPVELPGGVSEAEPGRTLRFSAEEPEEDRAGGGETLSGPDRIVDTWDELASGLVSPPPPRTGEGPRDLGAILRDSDPNPGSETPMERPRAAVIEPTEPAPAPEYRMPAPGIGAAGLSGEEMDRIAAKVVERLSDQVIREIAWEVIPEIAEGLIRKRIQELEEKISREG